MSRNYIVRRKSVYGGVPIINGTRISVDLIIKFITNGATAAEILREYPPAYG